jgi:hypothetical protein
MINKINKERRRSIKTQPPYEPATRTSGKEPRRTPNKKQVRSGIFFYKLVMFNNIVSK